MLGRRIADPAGIEGPPGTATGLDLLDVETVLGPTKALREVAGADLATGHAVRGYEMHIGATTGPGLARPMLRMADGDAGAVSADGRVAGCYLHGLFAGDAFRRAFIAGLGGVGDAELAYEARIESTLDALANHLERHLDIATLLEIADGR
jgi:adenosylcobyric acid synthase